MAKGNPNSPHVFSNIIANMTGRVVSTLLAIVFTPIYISLLGIEAYGLIGFYVSLQAALSFLELGLSYTCNRELARCSGQGRPAFQKMLDTLRSLEISYWCIALLIGFLLSLSAPVIASGWLDSREFSATYLEDVVLIMAWVIAMKWPVGLYSGALSGLQQQVSMNVALVVVSVLNWGGAALILWAYEPSIQVFFQWQLLVAIISAVLFLCLTWFHMPEGFMHGHFSWKLIKRLLPFTAGVAANAIIGTILLQADKLILSAIVPLKIFAYYALASMMAEAVILLAAPISNAISPRMAQMVGANVKKSVMVTFFHLSAQSVNVLVVPLGLMLAVFSYEVLYSYTGSVEIAANASLALSIMAVAKILHANMLVPYSLQLAVGRLKLTVIINAISLCFFLPLVLVLAKSYGMEGAASAWLLVTLGYVFIGMPLILKQDLQGQWKTWILSNIFVPVLLITSLLLVLKFLLFNNEFSRWELAAMLISTGFISMVAMIMVLPEVRKILKKTLMSRGVI
ncbi:colanic acid exporter [Mariprofundus micogutta]|uniref:Colanic acid exporter n=1 Tax=Mariprofundus micogutta TaxID=1921010 RepID=A0A1L8CLI0_9PROT|nr:oligosaccharide flippase family protein [Mariprofundus micogutta]GAV19745.1 colanic acid exporter [Mariprofundus micogutta]